MHYYVVTGGPLTSKAKEIFGEGIVIAADRGIDFCLKYGITPAMAVGDMDSVSASGLEQIKRSGIPVKTYPVEKDMTDTEIALSFVPEDCDITIVCPLNGRLDHVMANLELSASLHASGRNIILDDGITEVHFLSGLDKVTIGLDKWGSDSAVSIVPLSSDKKASGVTTEGLYYPLNDANIEFGKTLSFSNKPAERASQVVVSLKEGLLAVIVSRAE